MSPRAYPDFGWGWLTHFLINLGNDLGTLYLLYFLARGAHYHDPQTGLLILMALYAVALLGGGYGTYWAAAPALLTQVLPAAADRAKDLGLINTAYILALVLAPLLAGVVLGLMNSYPALFALAGVVTIIAGWTVGRVRSVA